MIRFLLWENAGAPWSNLFIAWCSLRCASYHRFRVAINPFSLTEGKRRNQIASTSPASIIKQRGWNLSPRYQNDISKCSFEQSLSETELGGGVVEVVSAVSRMRCLSVRSAINLICNQFRGNREHLHFIIWLLSANRLYTYFASRALKGNKNLILLLIKLSFVFKWHEVQISKKHLKHNFLR